MKPPPEGREVESRQLFTDFPEPVFEPLAFERRSESVGICAGLVISAVHHMGLATLTHTPNPMTFLGELLDRPRNETAVLLFPVGYPADGARVPALRRKSLAETSAWFDGAE